VIKHTSAKHNNDAKGANTKQGKKNRTRKKHGVPQHRKTR
jgi:hypothetical protein